MIQTAIEINNFILVIYTFAFITFAVMAISIAHKFTLLFTEHMDIRRKEIETPQQAPRYVDNNKIGSVDLEPSYHEIIPIDESSEEIPSSENIAGVTFEEIIEPIPSLAVEIVTHTEVDNYMNTFYSREGIHNRKPLYVGAEVYDMIYEEVARVGGRKASVGAFAESVILEHFKRYNTVISQIKKQRW